MRLVDLMNEANLKIESLHEYYNSQINSINDKVNLESKKYSLGVAIDRYLLSKVTDTIAVKREEKDKQTFKFDELVENYVYDIKWEENDDGSIRIYYKMKDVEKLRKQGIEANPLKARKGLRKLLNLPNFLYNSTIMMLIIIFEEAVSGIFECLINNYPNAYLRDKTMTYSQLLEMDTDIDNLKDFLIKKEVEEIMRQNVNYWYELLNKNHKVNFDILNDYYESFTEIYYRRNIIVHNNCIINNAYIQATNNNDLKEGMILPIDKEYMERAFINTYIMIYGTFFKMIKFCNSVDSFQEAFFEIGFQHMQNDEWEISEFIFYNLEKVKEQKDINKLTNKVNYWISLKNRKGVDMIKDEVNCFDFSAMIGQFKVAKLALLDEYEHINEQLEEIFMKEIFPQDIEEWPLFIQYRNSIKYNEFVNKHKEQFIVYDYTPDFEDSTEINNDNCVSNEAAVTL